MPQSHHLLHLAVSTVCLSLQNNPPSPPTRCLALASAAALPRSRQVPPSGFASPSALAVSRSSVATAPSCSTCSVRPLPPKRVQLLADARKKEFDDINAEMLKLKIDLNPTTSGQASNDVEVEDVGDEDDEVESLETESRRVEGCGIVWDELKNYT
ncbi:hypothetical protein Syun_021359 [Stephania yunnanensis]|uniref:Uncharacterized protein n=1 Tax=Stephania yunnanensis TaxID=152371 RepID=A0AAP0NP23_9MAGN